ncbi:hypothetical protein DSLPV1_094 [Dishui lake phycodnavirus 1]|uniref:hypothetical protein n=1 Tax=Dishui lake phycodnavirus 1 TaxID=2079134 RepID=UPI000CD69D73|nr:hypothetical protein C5Y57_gp094 [Dishui lake phycodnavirus 1]AUT19065.1 hypothetical protein DSLPV1_094 [Dishui lake phycodnavirus 1]
MNWWVIALIVLVVYALTTMQPRTEGYREMFGFVGHQKREEIRFNDPAYNVSSLRETEAKVTNDIMNELVTKTLAEIQNRTGSCCHIIETTSLKYYTGANNVYKVQFMCVETSGFPYAFSVASTLIMKGDTATVLSLRSQPLSTESPSKVDAFENTSGSGAEFLDFQLVNDMSEMNLKSELEAARKKLVLS